MAVGRLPPIHKREVEVMTEAKRDFVVINLVHEYGQPLQGCTFAVASEMSEEELRESKALALKEYEPFIYMTMAMAEAIRISRNNNKKYRQRARRKGNYKKDVTQVYSPSDRLMEEAMDPCNLMIEKEEEEERQQKLRKLRLVCAGLHMTEIQRRRLIRYYCDGLTEEQIAFEEHVTQEAVTKSLARSLKAIRRKMDEKN